MRRTRSIRDNSALNNIFRNIGERKGGIDRLLTYYLPEKGPGFAVLVMVNGRRVLKKGYGHARIGRRNEEITSKTVFDMASLSKHFTAFGILMLIDQTTRGKRPKSEGGGDYRKLEFDTTLRDVITELPSWADKITIRDLLNHTSGIPDYFALKLRRNGCELEKYFKRLTNYKGKWYKTMPGYEKSKKKKRYLTNEGVLKLLARERKADPPGYFVYSNTGYVVLAEIIRRATGKSLRDFLKEEVFDRLGMKDTFVYDDTVQDYTNHALCYRLPDGECQKKSESIDCDTVFNYIHGDGNVHSTLDDLELWIRAWNKIDNPDIKDPESNVEKRKKRDKLIKTTTYLEVYDVNKDGTQEEGSKYWNRWVDTSYASGMIIYRYENRKVNSYAIHHGGNWIGFNSYLMRGHVALSKRYKRRPAYEVTVLVLSNYYSEWGALMFPMEIARKIAELFWPWKGTSRYNVLTYV